MEVGRQYGAKGLFRKSHPQDLASFVGLPRVAGLWGSGWVSRYDGDYKTRKQWSCSVFPCSKGEGVCGGGGGGLRKHKLTSMLVNPACLNEPQWSSLPFPWAHSRSQMQLHTSVNVLYGSTRGYKKKRALACLQLLALMMCSRAGHQFVIVCLGSCPVPYQPQKNEAKPLS